MSIILGVLVLLLLFIILTNFIFLTPRIHAGDDIFDDKTDDDLRAIKTLITNLSENWNKGDGYSYGALFDSQSEYITFFGERLVGSEQISSAHQKLFDKVLRGSKMDLKIKHIRLLSETSALIILTGVVNPNPAKKAKDNRKSIGTLTAIKQDGKWIFSSFQNTRLQRLSLFNVLIGAIGG